MGENTVASLFNRAVLDTLVGALTLYISILILTLTLGLDPLVWATAPNFAPYAIILGVSASFLLGHFVDKVAYLVFDHTIFARYFQSRRSTFDLPEWCQRLIEGDVGNSISVLPSKHRDLIDDSKADWITAYLITTARPEVLQKRADLIANFQFTSNLLLVNLYALLVIPTYLYFSAVGVWVASMVAIGLFLTAILYYKFSVSSLIRINTFENLAVFGLLLSRHGPGDAADSPSQYSATHAKITASSNGPHN